MSNKAIIDASAAEKRHVAGFFLVSEILHMSHNKKKKNQKTVLLLVYTGLMMIPNYCIFLW